jgi:UDP-N-acetylmuramoylalanine-D-glutamate ligase
MKNTMTNKKVLITGVGRYKLGSNNSAARFFVKQGAKVTVTDPKPTRELAAGLKHLKGLKAIYHLGGYRVVDFKSADLIIKNPGTRSLEPFLKIARRIHGARAAGADRRHHRHARQVNDHGAFGRNDRGLRLRVICRR